MSSIVSWCGICMAWRISRENGATRVRQAARIRAANRRSAWKRSGRHGNAQPVTISRMWQRRRILLLPAASLPAACAHYALACLSALCAFYISRAHNAALYAPLRAVPRAAAHAAAALYMPVCLSRRNGMAYGGVAQRSTLACSVSGENIGSIMCWRGVTTYNAGAR